jgi:hypothetical protein
MDQELKFHDTSNRFMVAMSADGQRFALLPLGGIISREDGLNLAAWIVALADPERREFNALVDAITGA